MEENKWVSLSILWAYAQADRIKEKKWPVRRGCIKTTYAIYKSGDKHHKDFQEKLCQDILISKSDVWKPIGDTIQKCKQKTTNQESGSLKRTRINEAGNYSTSIEPNTPNTPTSGDIGCSSLPSSDGSAKNKYKGKVTNMPSESFQKWVETMQYMNLTRQNETKMEMSRLKFDKDVESEKLSQS